VLFLTYAHALALTTGFISYRIITMKELTEIITTLVCVRTCAQWDFEFSLLMRETEM